MDLTKEKIYQIIEEELAAVSELYLKDQRKRLMLSLLVKLWFS